MYEVVFWKRRGGDEANDNDTDKITRYEDTNERKEFQVKSRFNGTRFDTKKKPKKKLTK
ncbi:7130_t:CDS:2 [Ambispora leptoticha]|uniref:7130_t:CDS:1 n=1 Tax=Ambispora leptoticha TaxID=144679 RepID=A0A9N9FER9_9GLOM|nr:7130_t:CDS:2 [Ambispora leptoticha]